MDSNLLFYYKILGLDEKATIEDVKTAYKKLSKKFHPDVNNGDKFFEERFKDINDAYNYIISNYGNPNSYTEFKSDENINPPVRKQNYFKYIIYPSIFILLFLILKPIIQEYIRESAGESLRNTYTKRATYTTNPSNTTQSNSIKFFDIPEFSNPEVQQFAEEYAANFNEIMAAAKTGNQAKLDELTQESSELIKKSSEIIQKMTAEDAQKWVEWSQKIAQAASGQ